MMSLKIKVNMCIVMMICLFGVSNVVSGDALSENGEWSSHNDDQNLEEGVVDEIQQSVVRM